MKQFLLLFIFISHFFPAFGQKPVPKWDAATLAKANTAKDEKYLSKQEKEVIFYLNLVRLNPKLFAETYLEKYLDSTKENDTYTKSLLKELPLTKPMGLLMPDKELFTFTKEHAIKSGQQNTTGHGNYKERVKKIRPRFGGYIAENCDYGNNRAIDIVMSLLIDENVPSLGHRKNILNPIYKFTGTSIQPHKGFEWNCVMEFGGAQ